MWINKKIVFAITLFLFSFNLISAQENFEGKVKFKISHNDEKMFLDYYMKDGNSRMEMGENKEAIFINTSEKSLLLMPKEKKYLDLDNSIFNSLPGMGGMIQDDEEEEEENIDVNSFKTGKTKTVLGYECTQWLFKDKEDDATVEAWVTSELGNFMLMDSPMGAGFSPGWGSSLKNNGFFPLLVITKDENDKETSRFEATEVNKKGLNNKLFKAPSDFDEIKIPGM